MENIFKKYRVKEINNRFIAQYYNWVYWEGIDVESDYLWFTPECQLYYCSFDNLEEAKAHLEKYKAKVKKNKTKYYY